MATCLLSPCGLFVMIHSCFASLGIMVEYNCLNTCVVYLVKYPNFDLMDSISFFSHIVFDEFIAKEGEIVHKVGKTLANRVVERRNMIMSIYEGELALRVLGGVCFRGSFVSFCVFELFLALL
jgi:hypothetical protein